MRKTRERDSPIVDIKKKEKITRDERRERDKRARERDVGEKNLVVSFFPFSFSRDDFLCMVCEGDWIALFFYSNILSLSLSLSLVQLVVVADGGSTDEKKKKEKEQERKKSASVKNFLQKFFAV